MDKKPETRVNKGDLPVEYTPFGSSETIKLTMAIVRTYIATKTKSGKEASDRDIANFIMLCKSRGLNPYEGDAYLPGYDTQDGPKFSIITAHQAFLKRATSDEFFDGMESGVIIKNSEGNYVERVGDFLYPGDVLLGGWATVYNKNQKFPVVKKLNLEARDKGTAQWKSDKAGMIVKCAEADALRTAYPNKVGNLYLREEVEMPQAAKTAIEMPVVTEDEGNEVEAQSENKAQAEVISAEEVKELQKAAYKSQRKVEEYLTQFGHNGTLETLPKDRKEAFLTFLVS